MISPREIKKKANQQYASFLRAALSKDDFFPLIIKGKKGTAKMPLEDLFAALKFLIGGSKEKKDYGYQIEFKTVNTRHAGSMSMPSKIYFEDQEDYLRYIEKTKEFSFFLEQLVYTRQHLSILEPWILQQPLKFIKHLADWEDLLKVTKYFIQQPNPKEYIRALPIDIHTKFIEQHLGILKDLLDFVLPENAINKSETKFEYRYGLLYEEPAIRLRALDDNLLIGFPKYVTDISLPLNQFRELEVEAETVFVVENKQTFLAFPLQTKSILIWGKGFSIEVLKEVSWLKNKKLIFWGDLDVQGFQMLHQLRAHFPQTESLLMDKKTYLAFAKFAVTSTTGKVHELSNLNKTERTCFLFLRDLEQENRLEQEHITQRYLLEALDDLGK